MLQPATFLLSGEVLSIWPIIGILAGGYSSYRGLRRLSRKRLIRRTPAPKIHSAPMGLVEISGSAVGPYVILSPFEGSVAYYCRSVVWELKRRGSRSEWTKLAEETLHVPFYIDDGTEKLLVDPRAAELDLPCNFQRQYNCPLRGGQPMPRAIREFLVRHDVSPDKHVKVEEYSIKPHQFLFALGTLSQNPGLDATVMPSWAERSHATECQCQPEASAAGPEIIRLSADRPAPQMAEMTQQQKIAAALTKAGISSPSAWKAAGAETGAAAGLANSPARSSICLESPTENETPAPSEFECFDLHPPVVLLKGSNDTEFVIASRSPRAVVACLDWKHTLMLWAGPVVTIASIYWLLALLAGL
jgi:hypothetical protein